MVIMIMVARRVPTSSGRGGSESASIVGNSAVVILGDRTEY